MVNVSGKRVTARVAVARGRVTMSPRTLTRLRSGKTAKGNVLATAHLAGVLGVPTWLAYLRGNAPFHYWVPDPSSGKSLWYPSVEIATGAQFHEWTDLFAHLDERLDA